MEVWSQAQLKTRSRVKFREKFGTETKYRAAIGVWAAKGAALIWRCEGAVSGRRKLQNISPWRTFPLACVSVSWFKAQMRPKSRVRVRVRIGRNGRNIL